MAGDPAALQLRLYQTMVEVASQPNMTIVLPVPIELLAGSAGQAGAAAAAQAVANATAALAGGANKQLAQPAPSTVSTEALASMLAEQDVKVRR
jgi:hypothetical protein